MGTWRVNSYGYPNPFLASRHAQLAWKRLRSFVDRGKYSDVKDYWELHPTDPLDRAGVESWKSAFEQFGLLYVLAGSNSVVITPGGRQLLDAVDTGAERDFAWTGLNLVLRYPLHGKAGRRSRDEEHAQSDLLPYWLLHAALLELDGLWQQEFFRILARVFSRSEAPGAVDLVRRVRAGAADVTLYPDPSDGKTGGVYNALNQVLVQAGLNHMLCTSARKDSQYFDGTKENWWYLSSDYHDLVELALGGPAGSQPTQCASQAPLLGRMPAAPFFTDEQDYFDYVGARVLPFAEAQQIAAVSSAPSVQYNGEAAFLITEHRHFTRVDETHIIGPIQSLCVLGTKQRVLVSDNFDFTYIVKGKRLVGGNVEVVLHRARPITDVAYVQNLFEGPTL